jgi:uncharacterized metal-binding protein YceD (DUF177 family)
MKIEFRKVPLQSSDFEVSLDSAKFSGTFCKISPKLAKIAGNIGGELNVDCCKCGKTFPIKLDEETQLLISDGVYKSSEEDEFIVFEVENSTIDFEEILQSELESLKSEYYICDTCNESNDSIEIEY